ncbi:hypothetical protein GN958_ATG03960 [Phytophthora infestans]|uniref:Uncharacterized protein n=1 Tax=Phytophthora infestans TaxID=4787 RepID=A0A8S9V2L3_PHYIN|nr:hypothetical protein GN958_ATG03960 [Phytophthora infestans]
MFDTWIHQASAAAITEGLRQSGRYKLLFMVRLESGRVVNDDLATIEIVLNSIELEIIPYVIIVNSVKKRQYDKMMEKVFDAYIAFMPVIDALDEEKNAVIELPGEIESFIRFDTPTVEILPQAVKPINIGDFKKVSESLRQEQEQLLNDKELLTQRMAELGRKSNSRGIFSRIGDFLSSITEHPASSSDRSNTTARSWSFSSWG